MQDWAHDTQAVVLNWWGGASPAKNRAAKALQPKSTNLSRAQLGLSGADGETRERESPVDRGMLRRRTRHGFPDRGPVAWTRLPRRRGLNHSDPPAAAGLVVLKPALPHEPRDAGQVESSAEGRIRGCQDRHTAVRLGTMAADRLLSHGTAARHDVPVRLVG